MAKLIILSLISLSSMFMVVYGMYMYGSTPMLGYGYGGGMMGGMGMGGGIMGFLTFIIVLIIIACIFDFGGNSGGGGGGGGYRCRGDGCW